MFLSQLSQLAVKTALEAPSDDSDAFLGAKVLAWLHEQLVFSSTADPTSSDDQIKDGVFDGTVYGNQGHDVLDGGVGADTLFGGQGDDLVMGGAGDDVVFGNKGTDMLIGGEGADVFITDDAGEIADFDEDEGDQVFASYSDYADALL